MIGAVTVMRLDLARAFTALELETMPLIASQIALALNNIELHAQMADAAIRDPLTGLWNRRHLDVALARLFAARARLDPSCAIRSPRSCSTSTTSARSTSATGTSRATRSCARSGRS